jgi:hypothetical protein
VIHEQDPKGFGTALFSDDLKMRYRLTRQIGPNTSEWASRVVFVMLNPSTANAFKPDQTITKCIKFARRWDFHVLEVVNLCALRTPYPSELRKALDRGAGKENQQHIVEACTHPMTIRVIAAWGKADGTLLSIADATRIILRDAGVKLWRLGRTNDDFPTHPLARGKHFIPLDREPQEWT